MGTAYLGQRGHSQERVHWEDKTVYTSIWKTPTDGPVMARHLNLDGDRAGGPGQPRR